MDSSSRHKKILLIEGHPDASVPHLGHALADAYAIGAEMAGHEVRRVVVARLDFPFLRSKAEWEQGAVPESLRPAQEDIRWSDHMVLFFPLWLGGMPAMFKAFLEQVARPGFALGKPQGKGLPAKLLAGRSARVVVTMGMPGIVYRWFFFAHSLRMLKRNILHFVGISPVRNTVVGMVEGLSEERRMRWFDRLQELGRQAA